MQTRGICAKGTGVGGALLVWAVQRTGAIGYSEIRLDTNISMAENLGDDEPQGLVETRRSSHSGDERVHFSTSI